MTTRARASLSSASESSQPRMSATASAREQALVGDRALGHDEQRGVLEPAAGQHPGQVRGHRLDGVGRRPVEDDRDRGGALGGLAQVVPRHLVGVAGRRGDEQPQVGGREQLRGERPVALLDRVDVGGVEDRQPGRDGVGRHQLEGVRVDGRVRDPLEVGQQAVLAEPLGVVGVVDQHRRPGRGPQHAGLGDPAPDQRVDQRRLAGAGGAADHGEQRGVDGHQPRDDVVLELVDHLALRRALLLDAGDVERQPRRLEGAAQPHERGQHLRVRVRLGYERRRRGHRVGTTCPGKAMEGRTARIRATCCWPRAAKSGGGVPRRKRWCRKPSSMAACW